MSIHISLDNGCNGDINVFTHIMMVMTFSYTFFALLKYICDYVSHRNEVCEIVLSSESDDDECHCDDDDENDVGDGDDAYVCDDCNLKQIFSDNILDDCLVILNDIDSDKYSVPNKLEDRMMFYENMCENNYHIINADTDFLICLKGRNFSKLLKNIKQNEFDRIGTPFIHDFNEAMTVTTMNLMKEFNASTGFTFNDEIILVFKNLIDKESTNTNKQHIFGGNVNKLITLISSSASVQLHKTLQKSCYINKFDNVCDKLTFSARHVVLPNDKELVNYFFWKSKIVCFQQFVSDVYASYFNKKNMNKLSYYNIFDTLYSNYNIHIDDYNIFLRNGTYIKRELKHQDVGNKKYWYNTYVRFALPDIKCNTSYHDLLVCKNFQPWEFTDLELQLYGSKFY